MGIAKGAVKFLLNESRQRHLGGRLLTLGRQTVFVTGPEVDAFASEFGVRLVRPPETPADSSGVMSDVALFEAMGFDTVEALDYSDYESPDHIFDLNSPSSPTSLIDRYDVIIDGGTLEHVFHLPNALRNVIRMLKVGGRVIHLSPSSNHIDHGFYMFSPTLFWDFYSANGFSIETFQIFRYSPRHSKDPWLFSDYKPGCLLPVSYGGLDDAMYGLACVVTKRAESTADRVPQQGFYVDHWAQQTGSGTGEATRERGQPAASSLRERLRRHQRTFSILRAGAHASGYVKQAFLTIVLRRPQSKGLNLPIVARY